MVGAEAPPQPSSIPLSCKCREDIRSNPVRFLFDHPRLAFCHERLEVGCLARCSGLVLLDHRALEGWTRIVVNDSERDREAPSA